MIKRLLVALVVTSFTAFTHAELVIEITKGLDKPTPIAIVPFGGLNASMPENISDVVTADLLRSGLFRPIPKGDMLATPTKESDIYFRDWRMLGAEFMVVGDLQEGTSGYVLQYQLFDVVQQRKMFATPRSLTGSSRHLRDMAHRVSDDVYQAITGIRGAFSTKIIYVEDVLRPGPNRYRLVKADADGAREQILFASSEPLMSPAWSNDSSKVAYVSFETSRPAIFIQDLKTGVRSQITNFKGLNGAPAWSPDDSKLALVLSKDGNPEIYTLELATKKLTRVTHTFASVIDTEPNWTPDGKALVFASDRGGNPQIYQVTLASKRVERLTFEGEYNARPRLSPDGLSLVMVHRENGIYHIAWMDMSSPATFGDMRILTETWLDESPSIAPNGAMLLYATQHNKKGVLAAVSMDAGVKFRLPSKQGNVREPAWSPFAD